MTDMLETPRADSPAYLRHEYRTPVNHIVGYSELLIDEAARRRLEPYIPVFRKIREGGHKLLESIQTAFSEQTGSGNLWEGEAFRANLTATIADMSQTLASLDEDLEHDHRETLADLAAIAGAFRRLSELAGNREPDETPRGRRAAGHGTAGNGASGSNRRAPRFEDLSRDVAPVPALRGGGKILIADDDAANRDLLRRRLECEGHEVVDAGNGLEVLEFLKDGPCDLVLLDLMMPLMDGFQTLARIKQDVRLRELPVIMISALEEMQSVVRCIEMGAEDYLPKPFNRVLLRARIGASLEKKWLRDRERRKTEELEQTLGLLEQAQKQLAVLASRDTLTGLANRRFIETHLDSLVRRGIPFMAIYIDLNGFKKINDTYGHSAGDDLLKQVGTRLRAAFRSTDVVGRWGGDEFVALGDVSTDVQLNISRIKEGLAGDFLVTKGDGHHRVRIGAAVGVAAWKPGDTAAELLRRADLEMYEEKLRSAG